MANAVIVDVRSPDEFTAGHGEGAINTPLNALAERSTELPLQRSPGVVRSRS